jgi:hypothetical protein
MHHSIMMKTVNGCVENIQYQEIICCSPLLSYVSMIQQRNLFHMQVLCSICSETLDCVEFQIREKTLQRCSS